MGNNVKSMYISLEESLKKLRTSYVDIFYVHWWDWETSVEEVMDGLHTLVQQGKVLYLVTCRIVLDVSDVLPSQLSRAFPIPLPGSCPKQISTLVIMARRRLCFIKVSGTSWIAVSSGRLSLCARPMVCSDFKYTV